MCVQNNGPPGRRGAGVARRQTWPLAKLVSLLPTVYRRTGCWGQISLIMVFIRVRAVHILREAERVLEAVLVEPRNGVLGRFWRALLCSVARTAPGEATRPPTTEFGTISNKSAGGDFTGRARIIENFNVPVLQSLPMEHSLCVVSQDSARCCSFLKIMSP